MTKVIDKTGLEYYTGKVKSLVGTKQDKLTAGNNIQIAADGKTISATDTTYSAGNGLTLTGTQFSANVVDNTSTTSTTNALSANMGKELQDQINNLKAIGRYLSNWDCTTGLPTTDPTVSPYTYKTGDYYIVSNVASSGGTNYKPDGSTYTIGVASTTVETGIVYINDYYIYDSTTWKLIQNTQRTVSFANIAGQPTDNSNLASALNAKQNTLTAGTNISISGSTISATDTKYTAGEGLTLTGTEFSADTSVLQGKLIAGSNIQIDNNTISATDTLYTAGTGISIDSNNVISNTQTSAEWGNITGTLSDQTDLQTALDNKVTKNNTITGNTKCKITYDSKGLVTAGTDLLESDIPNLHLNKISDVTATASELNVLDGITATTTELNYTDGVTSNIQTQLDSKQSTLTAGTNITIDADNVISASGAVYTAGTGIDITNNIISAKVMEGSDGTVAGSAGIVPAPAISDNVKYLRGDGTWADKVTYDAINEMIVF